MIRNHSRTDLFKRHSLLALYVFNDEFEFEIFSELDFPLLKINEILGLYVKLNKLFFNLNGVSILVPNIGNARKIFPEYTLFSLISFFIVL